MKQKTWQIGPLAEALLYPVRDKSEEGDTDKRWVVEQGPPALRELLEGLRRGEDDPVVFRQRVGKIEWWLNEQVARITLKIGAREIRTYDGTRDYVLNCGHGARETLDFILQEVERVLNWQHRRKMQHFGEKELTQKREAGKKDKQPRAILTFVRKYIEGQPEIDLKYLVGLVPELRENARTVLVDGKPYLVYRIKSTLFQEDKEGIKRDHRIGMRSLEPYVTKMRREVLEKTTH